MAGKRTIGKPDPRGVFGQASGWPKSLFGRDVRLAFLRINQHAVPLQTRGFAIHAGEGPQLVEPQLTPCLGVRNAALS